MGAGTLVFLMGVGNLPTIAAELMNNGVKLVTDGTDNHLILIDLTPKGLAGNDIRDIGIEEGIAEGRAGTRPVESLWRIVEVRDAVTDGQVTRTGPKGGWVKPKV
jgi:glycine hydroxymethyltransferase